MSIPACFECGKEIDDYQYTIIPLDKPYINLYFHKKCFVITDVKEYLADKKDRIYDYGKITGKSTKK